MMRTLDVEICTYGARSPTITSGGVNRVIRFSIIAEKDNERGGQERKSGIKKIIQIQAYCHSKRQN